MIKNLPKLTPINDIDRFNRRLNLAMATFLGTDVARIVQANGSELKDRIIDVLLEGGIEINPETIRAVSVPCEYTEMPANPTYEGFIERYDRVIKILSIAESGDALELEAEEIDEMKDIMVYVSEFARLCETIRIENNGAIEQLGKILKSWATNG